MKPYDILAIGELNVDLILNRIDGQPEVGKEKFAENMILTLGSSTAIFAANAAALGAMEIDVDANVQLRIACLGLIEGLHDLLARLVVLHIEQGHHNALLSLGDKI